MLPLVSPTGGYELAGTEAPAPLAILSEDVGRGRAVLVSAHPESGPPRLYRVLQRAVTRFSMNTVYTLLMLLLCS